VIWRLGLILACVLAATLPPTATTTASAADPPERFFGVVQAIYNQDRAAQAGVQWERLIFPWSLIQPSGPDAWTNGYFTDQQVAQEAARGIELMGLAVYTPDWASATPRNARATNVPANLYLAFDDPKNYWGQFMFKLAQRYKGQIDTWSIWNEPDMASAQTNFTWDGSPEDLYQLVKVASQAIKKANPNARVALPGLTYWWDKENGRPLYLGRLLDVAAKDPTAPANGYYFDIVDLHQYTNPLNAFVATRVFQRALTQHGLSRPVWMSETNVAPYDDPSGPTVPTFHATLDQQAAYMIETLALARAAGLERTSVYKMVDERPEGPGELYGLVRNDGSTRPAFQAYRTAVRYLSTPRSAVYTWDGSSDPPTEDQITQLIQSNAQRVQWVWPAAVNRVTLERGAERVTVIWNASPSPTVGRAAAAASSAQVLDKLGNTLGVVQAQEGQYTLDLPPSANNTDPRDASLYLVGGDPRLLVEQVTPLPDAVDAPIQIVWPRDAATANISGVLLQPGSTQAVPCRWNPAVRLFASVDGGPPNVVANGARRVMTQDGVTFPVWDFNDVDISAAAQGKRIEFWMDVAQSGVTTRAAHWVYAADAPQPEPWQQVPTAGCG
jgi:hypothetical protein